MADLRINRWWEEAPTSQHRPDPTDPHNAERHIGFTSQGEPITCQRVWNDHATWFITTTVDGDARECTVNSDDLDEAVTLPSGECLQGPLQAPALINLITKKLHILPVSLDLRPFS